MIDWNNLTKEKCKELEFVNFGEELEKTKTNSVFRRLYDLEFSKKLFLIPIQHLDELPIGTEVYSISGKAIVFDGSNLNTDTRGGMLAYGILIE